MTALSLGHLPMQVGSVVLAASGRAARWIIARYMRQPLANTAILALVVTSAMAASNALYGQAHRHPSPLFAATGSAQLAGVDPDVDPVVPAQRPKKFAVTQAMPQKTAAPKVAGEGKPLAVATPAADATGGIGNKDVFDLQRKLEQLQLFTGTVDGYYGPQTARAIKKFEQLSGLKQVGQLTPAIVAKIMAAPLDIGRNSDGAEAAPAPAPRTVAAKAAAPAETVAEIALPKVTAKVVADLAPAAAATTELTVTAEPSALPQPTPLAETLPEAKAESVAVSRKTETDASVETGSVGTKATQTATLLGRPLPKDGDQAFQMAADTAAQAFDTIASGVQQLATGEDGGEDGGPAPDPIGQLASAAGPLPVTPKPGVPLPINDAPAAPGTPVAVLDTNATPDQIQKFSPNDPVVIAKVQRGLASLGYLQAAPDGMMNDATAKAIRQFETFYNYQQTGRISPDLLDILVQNGAVI
jgi:peptidoglycan hydrolase-like protein with peptidoglycan-binding domain